MSTKDFDFNKNINVNSNPTTDSVAPNPTAGSAVNQAVSNAVNQAVSNAVNQVAGNTVNPTAGMSNPRDPNKIVVTIADTTSPIVILYGAGSAGKTMLLIRLARYIQGKGYSVVPDKTFCGAKDTYYTKICDDFQANIRKDQAAERTGIADFILLKVLDEDRHTVCQLLEAPGEHFFDPEDVNKPFPPFMQTISNANNRRIWTFIVEKDWEDPSTRGNYAQRIINLQNRHIKTEDEVIFTCTKADMSPEFCKKGNYIAERFYEAIQNQYPGIFSRYLNDNPLTRLFNPRNFDFIPFSAGAFNKDSNGGYTYTESNDKEGVEQLWKMILKRVKGGW